MASLDERGFLRLINGPKEVPHIFFSKKEADKTIQKTCKKFPGLPPNCSFRVISLAEVLSEILDLWDYKKQTVRGVKKLEVGISSIHGIGVFAKVPIQQYDILGEYRGPPATKTGKYVLYQGTPGEKDWNARNGTNKLRYLNHSSEPNAVFWGWTLYANRNINIGEEITIDYGEDWGKDH